jgi:hypothetical protein
MRHGSSGLGGATRVGLGGQWHFRASRTKAY